MQFLGMLLAHNNLAVGIPIGLPLGIPIGIGIGTSSAKKKVKGQIDTALSAGKISILDEAGNPIGTDQLFELLAKQDD